jgi:hypothetical protein
MGSPLEQRTVQPPPTSWQLTRQRPSHSTTHDETFMQEIVLFGPARTPQRSTSWHE